VPAAATGLISTLMPLVRRLLPSVFICLAAASSLAFDPAPGGWPAAERDHKPWTRWWWPASAVDRANLTRQLEAIAAVNLGGVEVTPIYGAKGYEERYIDFLSPRWMEMLEYTGREAHRLGLGVDMATGTGWPFGGPWVPLEDSNTAIAMVAGRLAGEPTKMMVKRAAPGGEGLVLDPLSADALTRYLAPFTRAFARFPPGLVRAQFHDSFEYFGAGWTPKLTEAFRRMHGYDIQRFAGELLGGKAADPETLARVKSDYRETVATLHREYLDTWVRWSRAQGFITRNQSHGAPANILDLYGDVDVPETELFGSTPFPIPGLRRADDEVRHDQDLPDSLVIRMASSAAHVMGRRLVSSESSTWLRDNWKVALSYAKPELDRVMLDGINHVFYHGTVYSPEDVPWPGWLFYAATQYNPANPWWDDFGAMNRYVERVQSVLQYGRPDNDILLYWPVFDVWDSPDGMTQQLGVHDVKWLADKSAGRLARSLIARGYGFDYISDAQLALTKTVEGELQTPGARYKILVVPASRRMPVATLERIVQLARTGGTVVFESMPEDVPGYGQLADRRSRFHATLDTIRFKHDGDLDRAQIGKGGILRGNVLATLPTLSVVREPIAETGVGFIRRANPDGHDYFFANLTAAAIEQWMTLGTDATSATLLDPLTGSGGPAAMRHSGRQTEVYLQLAPGESLVLRTMRDSRPAGTPWPYTVQSGAAIELSGPWNVQFLKGGPELPPPAIIATLASWTELGGEAQRFAGTARYRLDFDLSELIRQASSPDGRSKEVNTLPDRWALDLGDVRESARVRLNGEEITTVWSVPFVVRFAHRLRPGRNVLELDVTNLAANRIRDMDRRGVPWKIMREINFVDINYRPFDASRWELKPSGLLGPVRLIPLATVRP
jgi:alpha-L-rhamnosidase